MPRELVILVRSPFSASFIPLVTLSTIHPTYVYHSLTASIIQSLLHSFVYSFVSHPSCQVLVNDLLTRVETNNEELMALLQERDQLHMEQDSMLVDIEDLIKQCKRQAELNNRRGIPR